MFALPRPSRFLLALMLGALAGCATERPEDPRPLAECPVCRVNADLACLNVRVDGATPHAEYQGKTYYFCSEECRALFEKNPAKYAGR
jgi:YHS domain-containing protein